MKILKSANNTNPPEVTQRFKIIPRQERLQNYNKLKAKIFQNLPLSNDPSRSSLRGKTYWKNIKDTKKKIISTILSLPGDIRPFACVTIFGKQIMGLLDSGASISCISGNLCKEILTCNPDIKSMKSTVATADGNKQNIVGSIILPIKYKDIKHDLNFYLVPSLSQDLYLGVDFWSKFNIAPQVISEISQTNESEAHNLTSVEKGKLKATIACFKSFEDFGLGKTDLVEHFIDVGDAKPIKQRYFPVSPAIEKLMCEEIDRMIQLGVIEESNSPWSSPVVLVRKPGKVRLCLDSRKLNSVTLKDAYPLPHIEGILSRLPKAKFISSLDLKDAFWQIPLEVSSREKTAFTIPNRPLYHYKVMPFGLCNAPQTMCRLMDKVIPYNLKQKVFVYLDDLLLVSEDFDSHIELLEEVALHVRKAGLTINISKSRFCLKQVKYLGYIVGEGTLQTDPSKVSAIVEFPIPKTVKQLRRFLGLAGWYRRFISNFADVTGPLTDLLKKSKSFTWTEQANSAFNLLKTKLASAPVLVNPDFTKPFTIQCDASQSGVGAVLVQQNFEGNDNPIAFMSQKLNKAQRNYSVTEQECLAAVLAVKKFRPYIEGHQFRIITDHASLKWLMSQTDLSGRLARWSLKLQAFCFNIEHRKGSENVVPDALSRVNEDVLEEVTFERTPEIDINSEHFDSTDYKGLRDKIGKNKSGFPKFKVNNKYIYFKAKPSKENKTPLESQWKLFIPKEMRVSLMEKCHTSPHCSHGGVSKTVEKITRYYYWPGLYKDIKSFVSKCEVCKTTKPSTKIQKPPLGMPIKSERVFQRLYIDLIGPFPRSKKGNIGIFIVLDHLSKFTFLFPVKRFRSAPLIQLLKEQIFDIFGVPEYIHSDNGSQFRSGEFQSFVTQFGIQQIFTAVYSPQSNSAERVNRSVNAALRAYIKEDQKDWDGKLSDINCALRSLVHQSLGYSPYFALFGQNMITHGDSYRLIRDIGMIEDEQIGVEEQREDRLAVIRRIVRDNLAKAQEKNVKIYDLRTRPIQYKPGEMVLRRNFCQSNLAKNFNSKLAKTYIKARVREKIGSAYYVLENEAGKQIGTYHAKDLRKL